jgi:uncharacterized protein YndB with AHSA1/START domain
MTETKQSEEAKRERRVEKEVDINASVEEVWKALTDANELARQRGILSNEGRATKVVRNRGRDKTLTAS